MFIKRKAPQTLVWKGFEYFSGSQSALFCRCLNLPFWVLPPNRACATLTAERSRGWETLMNTWVAFLGLWLKPFLRRSLAYSKFLWRKLSFISLIDNCFVSLNDLITYFKIVLCCFKLPQSSQSFFHDNLWVINIITKCTWTFIGNLKFALN